MARPIRQTPRQAPPPPPPAAAAPHAERSGEGPADRDQDRRRPRCSLALIALVVAVGVSMSSLPGFDSLKSSPNGQMIRVHAVDGTVLVSIGPSYGQWLHADQIPQVMKDAMVSVEDRRFYEHPGVDPIGILRSVGVRAKAGHWTQGGSTITQQLARNIFLTNNKNFGRANSASGILALALERKFSKERDPRTLSQQGLFRRRQLRHRRRVAQILRPWRRPSEPRRGGDHRRPGQGAVQLFADRRRRRPRSAAPAVVLQTMVETGKISQAQADRRQPRRRQARARARAEQRALFHRLGAAPALDADRRHHRPARRVDDARSRHAAPGRSHDPAGHARRPAGRAGLDGARRRGARDGRRQGLYHLQLQPRGDRAAPARLVVEAVRLSRGDRGRPQTRRTRSSTSPSRSTAGARATTSAASSARSTSAPPSRCRSTRSRPSSASCSASTPSPTWRAASASPRRSTPIPRWCWAPPTSI